MDLWDIILCLPKQIKFCSNVYMNVDTNTINVEVIYKPADKKTESSLLTPACTDT